VVACGESNSDVEPFLILKAAAVSPGAEAAPEAVVVQARGGGALLIRTENGTHRLGREATSHRTSCIETPESILTMGVQAMEPGALLTVDLLGPPPQVGDDPTALVSCRSPVLRSRQLFVAAGGEGGTGPTAGVAGVASAGDGATD